MSETEYKYSISFIIPVLNGAKFISRCLEHIQAEMVPSDEIIVVDNGSTDDTIEIANKFDRVKIIQYPIVTIAALRNRGADFANGDIFAFIDSDCLVCPGWRDAVVNIMSDASIQATGSITDIPINSTWVERAWLSERANLRRKVNYINSANFVVRKECFVSVGGFNESLITDEDCDIGAKITAKGFTILHAPEVRAIHLGNAKTIRELFTRKLWHSTTILDTAFKNGIDKPFIMTILFMLSFMGFAILLPMSTVLNFSQIIPIIILFFVPVLTVSYRVIIYKNYRYFFYLIVLYFVFYLARSLALIRSIVGKISPKQ